MTDRELMQMALDAIEGFYPSLTELHNAHTKTAEALRARLAQPKPQPVAWVAYENGEKHGIDFDEDDIAELPVGTMLYTAPPQREWQGLTDEEAEQIADAHWDDPDMFIEAIENALRRKNS